MKANGKTWVCMGVLVGMVFFSIACGKKSQPVGAKKSDVARMPLLQLVKIGMIKDEVESIVGQPIHVWDPTGFPLSFLSGIGEVWVYFNPFPESLPRKAYLYFDLLDKVVAIDRQGTGLPDPGMQKTFHFIANTEDKLFYLRDTVEQGFLDDASWSQAIDVDRFAVANGIIGIATLTQGYVPVTVEVSDTQPAAVDKDAWTLVHEARIVLPNGFLVLEGSGEEEVGRIAVNPGNYMVRVCYGEAKAADWNSPNRDFYFIILWPKG